MISTRTACREANSAGVLRKSLLAAVFLLLYVQLALAATAFAGRAEFTGSAGFEARLFATDPLGPDQEHHDASISLAPEYYYEWENGSSFTLVPFFRLDHGDAERSHFDLREMTFLLLGDSWELRLGVGKVFWGATEFLHLVDIINQTDLVEAIDEEEKLGQAMMQLSLPREWGTLDLFLLPGFRERTFPGTGGRLRPPIVVDQDLARYESSAGASHLDFAIRYSHSFGDFDLGVAHFSGTGRQPLLVPGLNHDGRLVLIPFYQQIDQTSIDIQGVYGSWLLKLESLYRTGLREEYFAATGGVEYSVLGIAGSGMDLGIIAEFAHDGRGDDATTMFDNDLMLGLRLAVNDTAGSTLLCGLIQDLGSEARVLSLEASRRLGRGFAVQLEATIFSNQPADDIAYSLRDDDYLRLELTYYF